MGLRDEAEPESCEIWGDWNPSPFLHCPYLLHPFCKITFSAHYFYRGLGKGLLCFGKDWLNSYLVPIPNSWIRILLLSLCPIQYSQDNGVIPNKCGFQEIATINIAQYLSGIDNCIPRKRKDVNRYENQDKGQRTTELSGCL